MAIYGKDWALGKTTKGKVLHSLLMRDGTPVWEVLGRIRPCANTPIAICRMAVDEIFKEYTESLPMCRKCEAHMW